MNDGHNSLVSNSYHINKPKNGQVRNYWPKSCFNMTLSPFLVFLFCGTEVYTRKTKKFWEKRGLRRGKKHYYIRYLLAWLSLLIKWHKSYPCSDQFIIFITGHFFCIIILKLMNQQQPSLKTDTKLMPLTTSPVLITHSTCQHRAKSFQPKFQYGVGNICDTYLNDWLSPIRLRER